MAKRPTRKAVLLTQIDYDEIVNFIRTGNEPPRIKDLAPYQRSRWKKKVKRFKVVEGEGLSFPNGFALYQLCREKDKLNKNNEVREWKIHVPPESVQKILCHFHPTDATDTGVGAHMGVRKTYEQASDKLVNKHTNGSTDNCTAHWYHLWRCN